MNIILQGLKAENHCYSATVGDLRAKFYSNHSSISFVSQEELLLNLDDELFQKRGGVNVHITYMVNLKNMIYPKSNAFSAEKWGIISMIVPN